MKIPISRYERLNTTTLETFLSTKPVFFEILYISQFDPPILAPNEIMVGNAILLERVTHGLSGDMTHDPTKIQNPPKIDDFTQFRNGLINA